MSRIAIEQMEDGLHPSEVVVTIRTADNQTEEVAVDRGLVEKDHLKVSPVGSSGGRVLVELPRETLSGLWRVWMPEASVLGTNEAVT